MANMTGTGKRGLCMNLGNCSNANQQKVLDIGIGEDFVCPECHKSLIVHNPRTGLSGAVLALGGVVLVAALAGVGWWVYAGRSVASPPPPVPAVVETPAVAPAPPPIAVKEPAPAPADTSSDRLPPCGSGDDARRRLKLCD